MTHIDLILVILSIILIIFLVSRFKNFANPPIDFAQDVKGMLGNYNEWKKQRDLLYGPQLIDPDKYKPNTNIYEMIYPETDYFGVDGPTLEWDSKPYPYFGTADQRRVKCDPQVIPINMREKDEKINWKSKPYPLFLPDEDPRLSFEENLVIDPYSAKIQYAI